MRSRQTALSILVRPKSGQCDQATRMQTTGAPDVELDSVLFEEAFVNPFGHIRLLTLHANMWRTINALSSAPSIRTTLSGTRSAYSMASGVNRLVVMKMPRSA